LTFCAQGEVAAYRDVRATYFLEAYQVYGSQLTMSMSDLPSFDTSYFRYTQPPHPSWTYGEPVSTTEQGKKWAEEAEQGWKTINPSEEDPK
jgi:hypothetical protein